MKTIFATIDRAMDLDDFIHLKKYFENEWEFFTKKLAYQFELLKE